MLILEKWASEILILLTQLIMHGSTNLVDFIVKETEIGKCQGLPLFYVLFYSLKCRRRVTNGNLASGSKKKGNLATLNHDKRECCPSESIGSARSPKGNK